MHVRRAGAVVLLAGALAGCSSHGDQPRVLPTLVPASVPLSPSAVPTPSGIEAATPQGAAAFARFWFATLNAAAKSGETTQLQTRSTTDCRSCSSFVDSIQMIYKKGRIEGGVFSVVLAEAPGFSASVPQVRVDVIYDVSPTRIVDGTGKITKQVPARKRVNVTGTLVRKDQSWLMKSLVVQP